MIHVKSVRDALKLCDAIGSEVRTDILEQIMESKNVNLNTLAQTMHLTNGALTTHIRKLENAGLINVRSVSGKRGMSKQCSIAEDKILIDIDPSLRNVATHSFTLPIGSFSAYRVSPHCGIAEENGYFGELDNERYFSYPERINAKAIWYNGYVTYDIPKPARENGHYKELRIEFEAASLNSGTSGVIFIDDKEIGSFPLISPHERAGILTPEWFSASLPRYGSLKVLTFSASGIFIDGIRLSPPVKSNPERLKIASDGIIIFSSSFGDYNTNIDCNFFY